MGQGIVLMKKVRELKYVWWCGFELVPLRILATRILLSLRLYSYLRSNWTFFVWNGSVRFCHYRVSHKISSIIKHFSNKYSSVKCVLHLYFKVVGLCFLIFIELLIKAELICTKNCIQIVTNTLPFLRYWCKYTHYLYL